MGQEIGACWHPTCEIEVVPGEGATCGACGEKVDWSKYLDPDLVVRLDLCYELVKDGWLA
jgi:hypothetical protein